ncbi:MAG TPA: DUF4440 domain-containing protein [Anaerolineales bacterium]|nr:DUF4440 domain-containing protein [Anaerolineales bacterium]
MSVVSITSIRETIAAANGRFMAAFNKGDAAGVAERYTEQGQVLMPNADTITGRRGIQMVWQGAMLMGNKGILLDTTEVEEHGEVVYEVGKYTLLDQRGKARDTGKYIVIWKQEAGEWKMHRDIWNSNRPAPGQLPNPVPAILKFMKKEGEK